jgi:hypothetical protein
MVSFKEGLCCILPSNTAILVCKRACSQACRLGVLLIMAWTGTNHLKFTREDNCGASGVFVNLQTNDSMQPGSEPTSTDVHLLGLRTDNMFGWEICNGRAIL